MYSAADAGGEWRGRPWGYVPQVTHTQTEEEAAQVSNILRSILIHYI